MGIFFWINSWKPALPHPYSEDLWWRAIWMKEIPRYQVDEVTAVSRRASLGVRPYCRTRKHQWGLFRSCVNWLVYLSRDEGDTNENITCTWKYKIILFVLLLFWHYFNSFNFYGNGELPSNQIGRSYAEIKKTEWKFTVMSSCSKQNLEFGHFTLMFCRGWQRNVTKFKTCVQNSCFCSLHLLFCGVFTALAVVIAQLSNSSDLNGTDTKNRI